MIDDAPASKNSPASGGHGSRIANRFAYGRAYSCIWIVISRVRLKAGRDGKDRPSTYVGRDRLRWTDEDGEGGDKIKQSEAGGIRRGSLRRGVMEYVFASDMNFPGDSGGCRAAAAGRLARYAGALESRRSRVHRVWLLGRRMGKAGGQCIASISGGREGKEEKPGFNEVKRRYRRGGEEDMNEYVAWSRACGVRAAGREGGCIQTKDGD
ncbi:hypothetical protein C8R44DRAFT_728265 [Mycena epipterygia]|nr:hypothetical protein C8R44DRAFT_728265 [Mycena epipterygia]